MSNTPLNVPPANQAVERPALNKVMWFGIVQLIGFAAGWAVTYYLYGEFFASLGSLGLGPNSTPAEVSAALGPIFQSMVPITAVSFAIEIVGLLFLTLAFRDLVKVNRGVFYVPMIFTIILVVGVAVAALGFIPLINSIPTLIAEVPTNSTSTLPPAFAAAMGNLLIDSIALVIAGILALIGIIGGQILGLWRVGTRYDQTLIKLGAIFTIIPLLNIVAPILVLIGAYEAKGRLVIQ